MKIAFISHEFPPDTGKGGIGTYTEQMASLLAKHGWNVHIFSGSPYRSVQEIVNGFTVHRVQCHDGFDFKKKALSFFAVEHKVAAFQLIESPEINSNALEIKQAFPMVPLVVRLHAPDHLVESLKKIYYPFKVKLRFVLGALRRGRWDLGYWRKYDFKNDADYQFCKMADFITVPSEAMKSWVIKNWEIEEKKVKAIANPFTPPEVLLNLPIPKEPGNKQIVFFGRLNVLKGLVNATLAMKKILALFPGYSFKVIGDDGPGPYPGIGMKAWMQQQLSSVRERVFFFDGFSYDQLPAAIADAEIALLPSLFESFSYTCAEAMAAGKAIIGSKNTGMQDMIQHRENGLLVDPHNERDIFEAARILIEDNQLRYRLAVNARNCIAVQFNNDSLMKQQLLFYQNMQKRGA